MCWCVDIDNLKLIINNLINFKNVLTVYVRTYVHVYVPSEQGCCSLVSENAALWRLPPIRSSSVQALAGSRTIAHRCRASALTRRSGTRSALAWAISELHTRVAISVSKLLARTTVPVQSLHFKFVLVQKRRLSSHAGLGHRHQRC